MTGMDARARARWRSSTSFVASTLDGLSFSADPSRGLFASDGEKNTMIFVLLGKYAKADDFSCVARHEKHKLPPIEHFSPRVQLRLSRRNTTVDMHRKESTTRNCLWRVTEGRHRDIIIIIVAVRHRSDFAQAWLNGLFSSEPVLIDVRWRPFAPIDVGHDFPEQQTCSCLTKTIFSLAFIVAAR